MRSMLRFAAPMILGTLLQQGYNIADTLIVDSFSGRTRWRPSDRRLR